MIATMIILAIIGLYSGLAIATSLENHEACRPEPTCDKCGNPGPVTFHGRRMCVTCYKAYLRTKLTPWHEGE